MGDPDRHRSLDGHLARAALPGGRLGPGDLRRLDRADGASPLEHLDPAETAGALAAARRGQVNAGIGERAEERAADRRRQLSFIVDRDHDVARGDELCPRGDDRDGQRHDHGDEQDDGERDLQHDDVQVSWIPEKVRKPSDISPTMMNVMPSPCSPSGMSLYRSRSRIAASAAMASAHPAPLPRP